MSPRLQGPGLQDAGQVSGAGRYLQWRLQVDPENVERLASLLWESGTLGLELREQTPFEIVAWFTADRPLPTLPPGVLELERRRVAEEDWLAPWRRASRPLPLGHRFVVDPREPEEAIEDEVAPDPERWLLRLPARRAFGTGSHPTTRLVLEALEEIDLVGRSVLDVGCGNGILAFASLLLGADSVVGFDLDPVAPIQARDNARLNVELLGGRSPQWLIGGAGALAAGARFDLILVNVLLERIRPDVAPLARRLAADGRLLLSGFQPVEEAEVEELWGRQGLRPLARRESEDWVCLLLASGGDGG